MISRSEIIEPDFSQHLLAMTAQGLRSKADIADELALRDMIIRELQQRLEFMMTTIVRFTDRNPSQHEPLLDADVASFRQFSTDVNAILNLDETDCDDSIKRVLGSYGNTCDAKRHNIVSMHDVGLNLNVDEFLEKMKKKVDK